jgi:hypothetical protein
VVSVASSLDSPLSLDAAAVMPSVPPGAAGAHASNNVIWGTLRAGGIGQ